MSDDALAALPGHPETIRAASATWGAAAAGLNDSVLEVRAAAASARSAWFGPVAEDFVARAQLREVRLGNAAAAVAEASGVASAHATALEQAQRRLSGLRPVASDLTGRLQRVRDQRAALATTAIEPGAAAAELGRLAEQEAGLAAELTSVHRNAGLARSAATEADVAAAQRYNSIAARAPGLGLETQAEATAALAPTVVGGVPGRSDDRGADSAFAALHALDFVDGFPDLYLTTKYLGIGVLGAGGMLAGRFWGSPLWTSGLGRYAAANRWIGKVGSRFPMLSVAINGIEAAHNFRAYGPGDARFWEPTVTGVGTVAAFGVVVLAGGPGAAGAAAFGGGMLLGHGVDWAVGEVTGERLSDRWVNATVGRELDAMNAKLDAGESLSAEEEARLDELQTGWGAFKAMFGF